MAENVPAVVNYGKVRGYFVEFLADTADVGDEPDQRPLNGVVTLTPSVGSVKWAGTEPPRIAALSPVFCPVWNGYLCPPGTPDPGIGGVPAKTYVSITASEQPFGNPDVFAWTASFQLGGITSQPESVTFLLEPGGDVNLVQVQSEAAPTGTVIVVSEESRLAAEAAAIEAVDAMNATTRVEAMTEEAFDGITPESGVIYLMVSEEA